MKIYWVLVLCFCLAAGCHTSKKPVQYQLEGSEPQTNLTSLQRQYPDAAGVYLFYKHDISHDLKPDFTNNAPRWYFFESYHWQEAVLQSTPDSVGFPVLNIELADYEKIRAIDYSVTHPDGTAHRYRKSDLKKKRMGGDSTRYHIETDNVPVGSVVEVAYEIERGDLYGRLPLQHDIPFQTEKPTLDLKFAYNYPWHWDVQVKQIGLQKEIQLTSSKDERAETAQLRYEASDVPAFSPQHLGPYLKEVAPYFHVQVNRMEVGNRLVHASAEAWEEIAQQYTRHAGKPGKKVANHAQEVLTSLEMTGFSGPFEKIEAIMAHVETDISYDWRSDIDDVVKKQRGDAFAITTYTRAMLEAAGFSVAYLIAHSAKGGYFDDAFIAAAQLYQPVLRVDVEGEMVYLFPAMKHVPVGYIPSRLERQPALLFAESAYDGFTTIGTVSASAYNDQGHFDVFVDAEGETRVEAVFDLGQYSAYHFAQSAALADQENTQSIVQRLLPHEAGKVEGLTYRIESGPRDNPTRVKAAYMLKGCVEQDGTNVVFQSCGLFDAMHTGWATYRLPKRVNAAAQTVANLATRVNLTYPASWTLLTDVNEVAESVSGGQFSRSIAEAPGYLKVDQHLKLMRLAVQPIASTSSTDLIALPPSATLPLLELTSAPVLSEAELMMRDREVEKGGPWTLVVDAYDNLKEAEQTAQSFREALAAQGYEVNVLIDGRLAGEFRVVIGRFATRTGIESAREKLAQDIPYSAWMLALKPQMTAVSGGFEPVKH